MRISTFRNIRFAFLFFSILLGFIYSDNIEISYTIISKNIIELDSHYIIEQIKFSKISENSFDYLLGIFEAANYSNFFDALPIGMIKENDVSDSSNNELTINIDTTN